jgi:UDP-GlcNAc:undecaprenyl-phosphate/decaprenyl-phosphate GlcNAc-1-phosphate transferase
LIPNAEASHRVLHVVRRLKQGNQAQNRELALYIQPFTVAFLVAVSVGLLIHATAPYHRRWTADPAGSGVQKQHHGSPSRVGLLPILLGVIAGLFCMAQPGSFDGVRLELLLLASALPAALTGLLEDVTKKIRARWRLLAPAVGTVLAMMWLDAGIPKLGVPILDTLLAYWPIVVLSTILMVVGFTQAMNIVDGLNGLSSGLAILMLCVTAWAAHLAGDAFIARSALLLAAATLGFWVINFPRGLMFLGDGGAYFLGFVLAVLWVMLLVRNPDAISVWFVLAVASHPTIETIFSIVRRRFLRARPRAATAPDRLHLHSLMFRRRTRALLTPTQRRSWPWAMNSLASALLLVTASLPMLLAAVNPAAGSWNLAVLALSILAYLVQFHLLTQFKGPRLPRFGHQKPVDLDRGLDQIASVRVAEE